MNTAPATPTPPAAEAPAPGWQPLPPRGARLYALNHALGFGVPAVLAAAALALSPLAPPWWAMAMTVPAAVAVIAVIAGGALLGVLGALMAIPLAAALIGGTWIWTRPE